MKKSIVRSVAVAAACAAGLSASLTTVPAVAAAPDSSAKAAATMFGYKASVFGTKVRVNNVELRTLRDANLQLPCTRKVGVYRAEDSVGSLPIANDLIKVAASTSESSTYRNAGAGISGVRAVNTVANIALGGELAGVPTPVLKVQGLQSVADSFFDAKARGGKGAFKSDSSFGYKGLSLDLPEGNPISDTLNTLFDALGVPADEVFELVNVPVRTLVDVLSSVGTITIPGLGAISLGTENPRVGNNFAASEAYALKLLVNATGEETTLQLGRASSRISRPVTAGVFRSTMSALELSALGDLVSLGGISQSSIPCEGTFGKKRTISTASASLVHDQLGVTVSGIKYAYKGLQKGKIGKGFTSATIGSIKLNVPNVLDIVVTGLTSRVDVLAAKPGQRVQRKVTTTFGSIKINGEEVLPKPGRPINFDGGVLQMLVEKERNFYGTKVNGLSIQLTDLDTKIDLAQVSARFLGGKN